MKKLVVFLALVFCLVGNVAHATVFTVTKLADTDDGACNADCSLREAVAEVNSYDHTIADSIYFDNTLFSTHQTITLDPNLGPLTITKPLFLIPPFTIGVTIDGANQTKLFLIDGGSAFFQDVTLQHGVGSFGAPGAIQIINNGTLNLAYCDVSNNGGGNGFFGRRGGAGAISVDSGTLNLGSSVVYNNVGGNGGGGGGFGGAGAIYVSPNSGCYVSNSTITSNSGGRGGDGSNPQLGSPNGGDGGAGGIANYLSLILTNSTIVSNTGGTGGSTNITSGTLGDNGVGGVDQRGSYCSINHTLLAFNSSISTTVSGDFGGAPTTDGGYNLLYNSFGSSGFTGPGNLLDVNPQINTALADNGGLTKTLALKSGSPAIDAGDPNFNSQNFPNDQRGSGYPRVFGGRVDIGAFESQIVSFSINDASLNEGNAGAQNLIFTVKLSAALSQSATVKYATANSTATAGSDYTSKSGTLTFAAGETSKTVAVPILGDTVDEANEIFRVNLSAPTNATLGKSSGIGTITDDDAAPLVSINDVSVTEGNSGSVNATFSITLNAASGQIVKINAIPTNGTAKAPGDYTSGGATLTFNAGETSKTFSVPVKGDTLDEANELFYVLLSSPVNCTISKGRGVGTIKDDDASPTISIDDVSITEGNSGQRTASFRLHLSAASGQVVKVNYSTASGTATPGEDYIQVPSTSLAFTVGSTIAYVHVTINGDVLNEANETFYVNLTGAQNATLARTQAQGNILNDDSAPALSINDVSIAEGDSGTKNLSFTVTLSKPSGQNVTVNYATSDGVARSTSDYVAQSGTLTFAPGTTSKPINVVINGDAIFEGSETLYVLLSVAVNASISKARGTGTINNDDFSG